MKKTTAYILGLFLLLFACNPSRNLKVDVSDIDVNVTIKRYGQAIFEMSDENMTKDQIADLHKDYPFFIDQDISSADANALKEFVRDPVNQDLYESVSDQYSDLQPLERELENMFKHMKYYFPDFNLPEIYTYISSLNYKKPVIHQENNLVIGLDMYLGTEVEFYDRVGVPKYKSRWFVPERIVPDVCQTLIKPNIQPQEDPTLLDLMVEKGKLLYLMEALMPDKEKKFLIRYTDKQMEWIKEYEVYVWGLIVDEELLFSKDRPKIKNFVDDGPFTSTISKEAPPRIAEWLGWRMIKKYMDENPDVTMRDLLQEGNSQKILKKSKYKPAQKARG
ncbi:MAG: hypothetical protein K9I29_02835 [Bacteroidales bacterium]|nr:hypothetical protein [Bacteroidales bacterium]MCF8327204.1 hypothetical protein [Bacteroidales bacterium]